MKELKDYIRSIPDFPKKGILFRDITSALSDPDGMRLCIESLDKMLSGIEVDVYTGIESRGFILSSPLSYIHHKAFVPIRKSGKLPCPTISEEYELEYGKAVLELDKEAIHKGDKVVIVDDLMATGGTFEAAIKLIERLGGIVSKIVCLIELVDLKGREKIKGYDFDSVIKYYGE